MLVARTTTVQKVYADRYRPGIGTHSYVAGHVTYPTHVYQCDTCGHVHAPIRCDAEFGPREPFYCGACAINLVSLDPSPNLA